LNQAAAADRQAVTDVDCGAWPGGVMPQPAERQIQPLVLKNLLRRMPVSCPFKDACTSSPVHARYIYALTSRSKPGTVTAVHPSEPLNQNRCRAGAIRQRSLRLVSRHADVMSAT
jgi:hypothetical protein